MLLFLILSFFFFNDTATTEIYTLSLHDALPISLPTKTEIDGGTYNTLKSPVEYNSLPVVLTWDSAVSNYPSATIKTRSEEHTSELQSLAYLVCRLLLEKKKKK